MKNRIGLRWIAAACLMAALAAPSSARINIFEPWQPGLDTRIGTLYSYQATAGLIRGERLLELPVSFSYTADQRMEVGGRWGIRSLAGETGISDLLLGLKYQFLQETADQPYIVGEAGVTLPTADEDAGLGTGTVGLQLDWELEKSIDPVTTYFGLGIQLNSENSSKDRPGNIFSYRIGASYPYRDPWRLYGEFKGFNHGVSRVNGIEAAESYQELYLAPGVTYAYSKRTLLSGALLIGLTPESHKIGLLVNGTF
jgi:hypothetical protein